jgi:hypothetical protein
MRSIKKNDFSKKKKTFGVFFSSAEEIRGKKTFFLPCSLQGAPKKTLSQSPMSILIGTAGYRKLAGWLPGTPAATLKSQGPGHVAGGPIHHHMSSSPRQLLRIH